MEIDALDFRAMEGFLASEVAAEALLFALRRGLPERLAVPAAAADLARALDLAPERLAVLLGLLRAAGAVERAGDLVGLSPAFASILPFRELLEARIAMARHVAEDLRERFADFVGDFGAFMAGSRTFDLFRYDRCLEVNPANLAATRRWVAYTTVLTRYEAGPLLAAIDLAGARRHLDLGGNSGEFAAQACRRAPSLDSLVFDLPVVCALGRDNLAGRPEAARVAFRPGDLRFDDLPGGHDLITFKSVLHDWPEAEAARFLGRAAQALAPGGRIVVAERAPLPLGEGSLGWGSVTNLVFQPFFRSPDLYVSVLREAGLRVAPVATVELETPFFVVTATKPA